MFDRVLGFGIYGEHGGHGQLFQVRRHVEGREIAGRVEFCRAPHDLIDLIVGWRLSTRFGFPDFGLVIQEAAVENLRRFLVFL